MEERLKTYLRPGEQVRWQGQPAPFSLLEAESKNQILLKWVLTVVLGGGLLAVYLSGTEVPSMGFIGLVLLVAACFTLTFCATSTRSVAHPPTTCPSVAVYPFS